MRNFSTPLNQHHRYLCGELHLHEVHLNNWWERKQSVDPTLVRPIEKGLKEVYFNSAVTLDRGEHKPFFKQFGKAYVGRSINLKRDIVQLGQAYPTLESFTWSLQVSVHTPHLLVVHKKEREDEIDAKVMQKGRSGPADFAMIMVWKRAKLVAEWDEDLPRKKRRKGNRGAAVAADAVFGEWKLVYSFISGSGTAALDAEVEKRVLGESVCAS